PNGKVDRRALPAVSFRGSADGSRRPPRGPLEQRLASIWERFLGLEDVAAGDSLFDLGGDSVTTVRLLAAVRSELGAAIDLAAFLAEPTIESLATLIGEGSGERPTRCLLPLAPDREGTPLLLVHPVGGHA